MTKVAIKNENITSFGGIYHIMNVFSKLGFEYHLRKKYYESLYSIIFTHILFRKILTINS